MTQINILRDLTAELERTGFEIAGSGAVAKLGDEVDRDLALRWLRVKSIVLQNKLLDDEEITYLEQILIFWRDQNFARRMPVRDTIDYLDQYGRDVSAQGLRQFLGRPKSKSS